MLSGAEQQKFNTWMTTIMQVHTGTTDAGNQQLAWPPLRKPLSESVVTLFTTGGVHRKTNQPFDIDREAVATMQTPGSIIEFPYRWRRFPIQETPEYAGTSHGARHPQAEQMLLVLDNFEQVMAAAPLVAELLAGCARLKCLVTSLEVLHLSGEHEFPVPPLELPDPRHLPTVETLSQYGAVALFMQRALAVQPDFRIDNANAPAIAEICIRLDGLPLAIELAAARIKLLPPQAMLARLGRRLDLLRGGRRDVPDRHQTL